MANLTRIFNNQITDNTIEWEKLKDGTLVGQKFNANLTLNSNVTVQGNLTVFGSYITTTSTNTNINDPLVIFNSGYTGSPTYDIGMLIDRNLSAMAPTNYGGLNAAWVWREGDQAFEGILTTETGTTAGAINRTALANVIVGNTIVKTTSGEVVDSVSTATGAFQVQGGVGITANLNVGVDNDNWNKIAGNSYFGTTTLDYPAGAPSGQQAIQTIKTFAGSEYNLSLVDKNAAYHSTFTQNTSGQLSIVTYQSGNDIDIAPNSIWSLSLAAANGSVIVQPTTDSTTADPYTTGALIVKGGTAIQGNLNVQGNASVSGYMLGGSTGANGKVYLTSGGRVTTLIGNSAVVVGNHPNAGEEAIIGDQATVVGGNIGSASSGSTLIGFATQDGGVNTTAVGSYAGTTQVSGGFNTFLGYAAGANQQTGAFNLILGSYDGLNNSYYPLVTQGTSNNIIVADGAGNVRIWVDPAGTTRFISNTISIHGDPLSGGAVVHGGLGVLGNIQVGGNAITVANGLVFGGNTSSSGGSIYIGGNILTGSAGHYSVTIGNYAGATGSGANATIIGDHAGNAGPGANDVFVGKDAGLSHTSDNSTFVGTMAGKLTTGTNNQFFGYNSGSLVTTGTYNLIIGAYDGNTVASLNNTVTIADGEGNPRLYVDNLGSLKVIGSEESTSAYGALRVEGGVSIAKKLYVGGDTTLSGNLTVLGDFNKINAYTYTLTDPIMELNTGPNGAVLGGSVNFDVGIKAQHWYDGASRYAFFGRTEHNGAFEYYAEVTSESGNVIAGTYGNVKAGEFHSANTTQATDKVGTVGAITTLGGASIARSLYVGDYSYISGVTNSGNLISSATDALIEFSPGGTGTVTINPATEGTIDNMAIGQSDPANARFSNLVIDGATGYNFTVQGAGYANVSPTGAVKINPSSSNGQSSNMDNVYIGNSTPRQGHFTAVNVGQDLLLEAFSANAVLFMSPSGNLSVDQNLNNFNYERATGNTISTVSLSVGTNGDFTGTDTFNIYYQGDSYLPQSLVAANTIGQSTGWTVSTSRGTGHAPANVQAGDFNGVFSAFAYTGATPGYKEIGGWKYVAEGTELASNGIGGQAQLWTKRDDGDNTLALRVDAAQVATFTGQVRIANTSVSNTTTEGALYVEGGASIGGNLNISQGVRINDQQNANRDFIVRGDNDATLIWASTASAYNQVLIGNSASASNLVEGAKLQIWSDDSILLPRGDDASRPAAPVDGMLRYNQLRGDIEFFDGSVWFSSRALSAGVITDQQFAGDNTTTEFELSREATSNSVLVSINGVLQIPGTSYAYTVVANTTVGTDNYGLYTTLRFTEAPRTSDVIDARVVTIPYEMRGIASINTYVGFTADDQDFGANIFVGTTEANVSMSFLNDGAIAYYGMGNLAVGVSPVVVDTFPTAQYRSAKYYFQVSNAGTGEYETSEVLVLHDDTTAYRTQYARIYTGAAALGSVSVSLSGGNVSVSYTGVATGNYVKTRAEYVTI